MSDVCVCGHHKSCHDDPGSCRELGPSPEGQQYACDSFRPAEEGQRTTLLEFAKSMDPDGTPARFIEALNENDSMIHDEFWEHFLKTKNYLRDSVEKPSSESVYERARKVLYTAFSELEVENQGLNAEQSDAVLAALDAGEAAEKRAEDLQAALADTLALLKQRAAIAKSEEES